MTTTIPSKHTTDSGATPTLAPRADRILSIDATRGLVMLAMIFVNDLAGAPDNLVPWWMKHYDELHPTLHNGMTFVDLVFPAFLFIVGLSIPFALGNRLARGESPLRLLPHVLVRTLSLLALGILMVNAESGPNHAPLSRTAWTALMFSAALLAFADIRPFFVAKENRHALQAWRITTYCIRALGIIALLALAFLYTNVHNRNGTETTTHLITLAPFSIHTSWYGILGLIGWAYLAGALLYLFFRNNRLPLAVATALLLGFWVADHNGSFDNFFLPGLLSPFGDAIATVIGTINHHVNIGESLGSLAAITTAGTLLATILVTPDTATPLQRIRFTLWFIAAAAGAAMLFYQPFLIWKDDATPPWCLWACSITAALWLLFYLLGDLLRLRWLVKPFAIAGQNVLLAYLFSEMMESLLNLAHLSDFYDHVAGPTLANAIARSLGIAILLLALTALLNRLGFRLKL